MSFWRKFRNWRYDTSGPLILLMFSIILTLAGRRAIARELQGQFTIQTALTMAFVAFAVISVSLMALYQRGPIVCRTDVVVNTDAPYSFPGVPLQNTEYYRVTVRPMINLGYVFLSQLLPDCKLIRERVPGMLATAGLHFEITSAIVKADGATVVVRSHGTWPKRRTRNMWVAELRGTSVLEVSIVLHPDDVTADGIQIPVLLSIRRIILPRWMLDFVGPRDNVY